MRVKASAAGAGSVGCIAADVREQTNFSIVVLMGTGAVDLIQAPVVCGCDSQKWSSATENCMFSELVIRKINWKMLT